MSIVIDQILGIMLMCPFQNLPPQRKDAAARLIRQSTKLAQLGPTGLDWK